jgi:Bacterial PH domain
LAVNTFLLNGIRGIDMNHSLENHKHFPPGIQEHDEEDLPGLPAPLPAGESLIWQGQPDWKQVAIRIVHLRAIALYFLMLFCWGALSHWDETGSVSAAFITSLKTLPFILMGLACFVYLARATAKHTLYTITSKRIVMRIGIALTITYNLPFSKIAGANVLKRPDGSGEIALQLAKGEKIAYLFLWPHARPWHFMKPQPMLRCLPNVDAVAQTLTAAWSKTQSGQFTLAQPSDQSRSEVSNSAQLA